MWLPKQNGLILFVCFVHINIFHMNNFKMSSVLSRRAQTPLLFSLEKYLRCKVSLEILAEGW